MRSATLISLVVVLHKTWAEVPASLGADPAAAAPVIPPAVPVLPPAASVPAAFEPDHDYQFPDNFQFGVATSAYQIEGGWDADGRGESIWDRMTHTNASAIADGGSGDVACDSYRLWRRDVQMLRELGVDYYRFSLSWPRLLPDGLAHRVNPVAVRYYNGLIDELLRYNITPLVTLYHWDLPQRLQDLGGWTSDVMAEYFEDYADVAFRLFGDRVKTWVTINEAKQVCLYGYGRTTYAPQLHMSGVAEYLCARTVTLAHARACRLYERKYGGAGRGGRCGLTLHVEWYEPASDNADDVAAAEDAAAFEHDMYIHPIFSTTGDWPPRVKERIARRSQEQGFPRSRLPDFSLEEIELIRGSAHFYGANSYGPYVVSRASTASNTTSTRPSYEDDRNANLVSWPSDKLPDEYWAYGRMFDKIREDYANPEVWVLESGLGGVAGRQDEDRARHVLRACGAVLGALRRGSNLAAYTAWSLMDNFEWHLGYTLRFGLYDVDFTSPNRTRTPKTSAHVYRNLLRTRRLDLDWRPQPGDLTEL